MPSVPLRLGAAEARGVRVALGLADDQPITDLIEFIEVGAGVPVFLAPLPGAVAGLAQRLNGRWYIVGDSHSRASRLRFTIAHEFGHIVLGHRPAVDTEDTLKFRGPNADPREVEANRFAGELLVPQAMVEARFHDPAREGDELDLCFEVGRLTGTSAWVSYYQLTAARLIPWEARPELDARLHADPRLDEAVPLGDEIDVFATTGKERRPDPAGPSGAGRAGA